MHNGAGTDDSASSAEKRLEKLMMRPDIKKCRVGGCTRSAKESDYYYCCYHRINDRLAFK